MFPKQRKLRASRKLLIILAAAVAYPTILSTSNASAGVYKLYSCNVPGRETPVPSTAPWTVRLDGMHTYFFNHCTAGQSFGIALNVRAMRHISSASLALVRPTTGPKSQIGIVRYRTWITAELAGSGAPAFIDEGGAFAPPGGTTPDDAPWISAQLAQDNPAVFIRLQCSGGAPSDCWFNSDKPLQVRGVEVDLYEDRPPQGVFEGGSLLDPGARSGQLTVGFSATDEESGVARVELLLGDNVVADANLESNKALCPHTEFSACPARYASDFIVDTGLVPPGLYTPILRITDAAGNRKLVPSSRPISIVPATPSPAASPAQLTAAFPRAGSSYATRFGRAVRIRGRLATASGGPIGGARIVITEMWNANAPPVRNSAVTDPAGRYTYITSGRRPSRYIEFRYGEQPFGATRRLRLRVRAASTFRVMLKGVHVTYGGNIVSRPIPSRGVRVFIQGRAVGGAWQRFAVRLTDRTGAFRGRYRLRVRRPGVRLQFRVEIPRQARYPFTSSTGRALTRRVR